MPVAIDAAISLMLALIDHASEVSQLIQTAKANGQTDLTADQWATLVAANDAARARLVDAIAKATP